VPRARQRSRYPNSDARRSALMALLCVFWESAIAIRVECSTPRNGRQPIAGAPDMIKALATRGQDRQAVRLHTHSIAQAVG
jgi:hypothetical protein